MHESGRAGPRACRRRGPRRARRGGSTRRRRAVRCSCTKPRRMPAGAAAPISIPSSAAASTTATTCCSPATGRRSIISNGSARSVRSRARRGGLPVCRCCDRRALGGAAQQGSLPWWVLRRKARVPGTRALRLSRRARGCGGPDPSATVAAVLDRRQTLFRRLWEPLAVAALNTSAEQASARLFWRILAETLGRGGAACRPLLPADRAVGKLCRARPGPPAAQGAEIRFGARLKALAFEHERVSELRSNSGSIPLGSGDSVILAVPAAIAARLVPGAYRARRYSPIVNAHFRCDTPAGAPFFVGVIGGAAEWIFRKRGVLSVTVSAADRFVDRPAAELRELFWRDVALAYRLPAHPVPPARIVKERRATFLASPSS